MPALLVLTGPKAGNRYPIAPELTMGRSPSCELPLEDERASRKHARIELRGGEAWLSDLGSKNGTFLNGIPVAEKVALRPGDKVQVGETTLIFEPPEHAALSEALPERLEGTPLEEALPRGGAEGLLFSAALALASAPSEAVVLRRAAEELRRLLGADVAAALRLQGDGWSTSAVVGDSAVEVPRTLAHACVERREVVRAGGMIGTPLVATGGRPVGLLFARRATPLGADEVAQAAELGRLAGERLVATAVSGGVEELFPIGTSLRHRRVVEECREAAATEAPVALHGPPGSGRTFFARYLHSLSRRRAAPLVVVECGRPDAAELLFGGGAGPGAVSRPGALLLADGGTLLCEDVDRLPAEVAERLARHLSEKTAPRLGGGEEPSDVRLVVTSPGEAELGAVPPALGALLAARRIALHPLEERREDVPLLFGRFLALAAERARRPAPVATPEAAAALQGARWPRNLRDLEALADRVALAAGGGVVRPEDLPLELREPPDLKGASLHERVARLEKEAIEAALREAAGRKIRAAALLGISRPTLDKKIAEYGLTVDRWR